MASGITLEMLKISRQASWRTVEPREKRERDRSLNGKARIRSRRSQ